LAHQRIAKVGNVLSEGQEVQVKVLSVDPEGQRMSLSLKALQNAPTTKEEDAKEEETTLCWQTCFLDSV